MEPIEVIPVGVIRTSATETTDMAWSKVISEIHVNPELVGGLKGLEDWSHLIIIFRMHESDYEPETHIVSRPRGREDMPETGVFAQRSRNRQNLIGITAVRLVGIEGNIVRVRGLDAIDGTPVLDIKPYAPVYDGAVDPLVPAWFVRLMQEH